MYIVLDLLKEIDSFSLLHQLPDVTEAFMVNGALDDDGKEATKHDNDLERVRPHYGFHAALQT